jgi:hypothetical protein
VDAVLQVQCAQLLEQDQLGDGPVVDVLHRLARHAQAQLLQARQLLQLAQPRGRHLLQAARRSAARRACWPGLARDRRPQRLLLLLLAPPTPRRTCSAAATLARGPGRRT